MDLSYLRPDVFRSWFGGSVRNAQTASAGAVKSMSHMPPVRNTEFCKRRKWVALFTRVGGGYSVLDLWRIGGGGAGGG